jgi:hypothetical protein
MTGVAEKHERKIRVERIRTSSQQQLLHAFDMSKPAHALSLDLVVKLTDD